MKLRYIANQVFQGVEKIYISKECISSRSRISFAEDNISYSKTEIVSGN